MLCIEPVHKNPFSVSYCNLSNANSPCRLFTRLKFNVNEICKAECEREFFSLLCGRKPQPKSATSLLFARKGKARSIGLSSRSNDMEGHFYGQCRNANLVRGLSELKKFDAVQKSAAMLIQLVWRERMRRRGGGADVQKKSQGHTCYAVDAPAYFGESCLWTPYSTWTTRAAIHEYTIRVKSQVEVVNIPRLAIAVCIEKFSPWLRNRFEVFQAAVLHDRDFLEKESQVSTKPSSLALQG